MSCLLGGDWDIGNLAHWQNSYLFTQGQGLDPSHRKWHCERESGEKIFQVRVKVENKLNLHSKLFTAKRDATTCFHHFLSRSASSGSWNQTPDFRMMKCLFCHCANNCAILLLIHKLQAWKAIICFHKHHEIWQPTS